MATDRFRNHKGFSQIEGGHIFYFLQEAGSPQKIDWNNFYNLFLFQTKDFVSPPLKSYQAECLGRQDAVEGVNSIGAYIEYFEYKESIPSAAHWAKKALIESGLVPTRIPSLGNKKGAFKGDIAIPKEVLKTLKNMAGESMSTFKFPIS